MAHTLTDEELAALKAISEPAAQLEYRELVAVQHPGLMFVYDNLRLNNSPEHAYKMVCQIDQSFKQEGIREETPQHGTHKSEHCYSGSFNPGGRHLRIEADGNPALSQDRRGTYSPRHLHAEGAEVIAQRLRYA